MEQIQNIALIVLNNNIVQIVIKLVLISVLAGMIGIEREHSSKPAGFRTHVLLGISAVLVMTCGIELANKFGSNDPSRMPAQLLSGIGFIGAGTILSNGFKVKGLTTASGLLAITCIGLCVGAGMYVYAIIATIIVYIILKYSYLLNSDLDHITEYKFKVLTNSPKEILENLNAIISRYDINVTKLKIVEDDDDSEYSYIYYECKILTSSFDRNKFITEFAKIDKVKQILEV